jgi:hypothetical protein
MREQFPFNATNTKLKLIEHVMTTVNHEMALR